MFDNTLKLNPVFSADLVNPSVKKLQKIFNDGFHITYIYGPPGSGKSEAVKLLLEDYGMVSYFISSIPETVLEVEALSRYNDLLDNRPIVIIVDGIDRFSKKSISRLIKGDWQYNKLIMIGYEWKRIGNPLNILTKSKLVFKKVKFDGFPDDIIIKLLLRMALQYKSPLTMSDRVRIAKESNGDLRKAFNATKNYILSGQTDLDMFLPYSKETYHNRVKRLFSGNYYTALEEVESFGWYYSILILVENLKNKNKSDDLIDLLMSISMNKMQNRERYIALIACEMNRKYQKGKYSKWMFPKRSRKKERSEIKAICSDMKKELYYLV